MALIILFVLGVANFAMHKAVLESRHPLLAQVPWLFQAMSGRFSLVLEFALLLAVMLLTDRGSGLWVWGYVIYTALNALSAWLILTRRV